MEETSETVGNVTALPIQSAEIDASRHTMLEPELQTLQLFVITFV
jgi:hypothetical protein